MRTFATHRPFIATAHLAVMAAALLVCTGAAAAGNTTSSGSSTSSSSKKPADCSQLDKLTLKDNGKAYADSVLECQRRGWEPPPGWKLNGGVNRGARAGGSTGRSVGTTSAPEVTGKSRNENASISRERMQFSCSFPPDFKVGIPPKLEIPKGSCWEFFAGLLKDKNGNTANSSPSAGVDPGACPAEVDNTGAYGKKTDINGGVAALECGGMVPLTTDDITLTPNPVVLATTVDGSYNLWVYKRTGNTFSPVGNGFKLPTFLCDSSTDMQQKTVDLTAPVSQMVTANANSGHIYLRLRSRASMNPGFIPPYNSNDPEKYLVIPIAPDGTPTVPADCSDEHAYFQTLGGKQDIIIESSTMGGCEPVNVSPTPINSPTVSCPTGSTLNQAAGKCLDSTGNAVAPVQQTNWVSTCASGDTPTNGVCPEAAGVPEAATCPNGNTGSSPNNNCTTTSSIINTGPASCQGKTQYSVLNRPNLYYPPATNPNLYPVTSRTLFMAETVNGSQVYTQAASRILLWPSAPSITLNNGGTLRFLNNTTLLMEGPATINLSAKVVTLTNGGELVNGGGVNMQNIPAGGAYSIPTAAMSAETPLELNVYGSMNLPAGYMLPTAPKVGSQSAYVREPSDPPPQ